jgi:hypothetical protein
MLTDSIFRNRCRVACDRLRDQATLARSQQLRECSDDELDDVWSEGQHRLLRVYAAIADARRSFGVQS